MLTPLPPHENFLSHRLALCSGIYLLSSHSNVLSTLGDGSLRGSEESGFTRIPSHTLPTKPPPFYCKEFMGHEA